VNFDKLTISVSQTGAWKITSEGMILAEGVQEEERGAWVAVCTYLIQKTRASTQQLQDEVTRLRVLGPDTEARIAIEARAIAGDMLQPTVSSWRTALQLAEYERDELRAQLAALQDPKPRG
jgi:hypothetical protein